MKRIIALSFAFFGLFSLSSCDTKEADSATITPSFFNMKVGETKSFSVSFNGTVDYEYVKYNINPDDWNIAIAEGTTIKALSPGVTQLLVGYFPNGKEPAAITATAEVVVTK